MMTYDTLKEKRLFKNKKGKGENAGNQHFLLFPQCFLIYGRQIQCIEFYLSSANALNFDKGTILSSG